MSHHHTYYVTSSFAIHYSSSIPHQQSLFTYIHYHHLSNILCHMSHHLMSYVTSTITVHLHSLSSSIKHLMSYVTSSYVICHINNHCSPTFIIIIYQTSYVICHIILCHMSHQQSLFTYIHYHSFFCLHYSTHKKKQKKNIDLQDTRRGHFDTRPRIIQPQIMRDFALERREGEGVKKCVSRQPQQDGSEGH